MRRAGGDRGAAAAGLIVTAFLVTLGAAVVVVLPLMSASDQGTRTSTAAQAAALAGAGDLRDDVLAGTPSAVAGGITWVSLLGASHGSGAAASLAADNDSTLIDYAFSRSTGIVKATTRLDEAAPGVDGAGTGHATSEASAALGVALGSCAVGTRTVVTGYSTPTPTPSPDPDDPEPTPTPVPVYGTEYRFTCPGYSTGWSASATSVSNAAVHWLSSHLEPSLVD